MASLSAYYPLPVVAGTTAGTYAEGDDSRIVGALPSSTAGSGSVLASGSTTSRTLSQRFGEVFHVDDYGAKGDWNGTTGTDDTAAIQAAINAAISYANTSGNEATVTFSAGKTYRLVNRQLNTVGQTGVSNHLNIYNGTVNTRLRIDGSGARLYGNGASPASSVGSNGTDIFYICTKFDTIKIENLYFEQQPHLVIFGGAPAGGIRMSPFVTEVTESQLFSVSNCEFENCTMPFIIFPFNNLKFLNKLSQLEIIDCRMLSYRGSAHNYAGAGNQTINLSRWVKNFHLENLYFNGAPENFVLPYDVDAPRDGLTYVGASHETYSNCYMTGNPIETIIPSGANSVFNSILFQSFVQPDYNNDVEITITSNTYNNELEVGEMYICDTSGASPDYSGFNQNEVGPVGVYRVKSFTGSYAGQAGQTVTFTRLQESEAEIDPKAKPILAGSTVPNNISMYLSKHTKERSLVVKGCKFIYEKSIEGYPYNITGVESTNTFKASGPNGGTCTISNANPAVITKNNHGFLEGAKVYFTTNGSLPSGITVDTIYYVRDVTTNTFTLSAIGSLGARIATTTSGSGTHTVNTAPLLWNNQKVRFRSISGGAGLTEEKTYYVVNKSTTSPYFQVSTTSGGSAFNFTSDVSSGTVSVFWRGGDPAIAGYCPATVTGNVFYGCSLAMFFKDQFNWGSARGSTIAGNYFTIYSDEPDQTASGYTVANISTNSCNFSNNTIVVASSKDTVYPLFIGADNCVFTGNSCVCIDNYNVPLATRFINWNNGAPSGGWKCIVENNFISGLDNYGNIGTTTQIMGPFMGTLRGSIASSGSQEIKIASRLVSPDKSEWLVRVTNDGELEVSK
jgi:hypothetical protein